MAIRRESLTVTAGRPDVADGPLNTPIVLAAPLRHGTDNHYTRSIGTDTIRSFEAAIGALEGGQAIAFASGQAATAAVVEDWPSGTIAVVPADGYTNSLASFAQQQRLGRMTVRTVPTGDTDAALTALPGSDLIWMEAISNPLLTVTDVTSVASAAQAANATSIVDSTFCTPFGFRPLEHGADLVMHSATKYLSGHSDVLLGVLVTASAERAEKLRERRTLTGAIPGALECYLALRGMRTLAIRMQRAQANAVELAARLQEHPRVTRVRYPGLAGDPGHATARRLFDGFGAVISFELEGGRAAAERLCASVRLITHATSLGGVESLIERRARHAGDAAFGTPESLLRFSVGIEHVEDLWSDLTQALLADH